MDTYLFVSDVLQAMKINPADCLLYRHRTQKPGCRRALESGFIKEYTSMQKEGFAKGRDYIVTFLGMPGKKTVFSAVYYIENRFASRAGHVPAEYPNREEVDSPGEYLQLREVPLPPGLHGFSVEWGKGLRNPSARGDKEKRILETW